MLSDVLKKYRSFSTNHVQNKNSGTILRNPAYALYSNKFELVPSRSRQGEMSVRKIFDGRIFQDIILGGNINISKADRQLYEYIDKADRQLYEYIDKEFNKDNRLVIVQYVDKKQTLNFEKNKYYIVGLGSPPTEIRDDKQSFDYSQFFALITSKEYFKENVDNLINYSFNFKSTNFEGINETKKDINLSGQNNIFKMDDDDLSKMEKELNLENRVSNRKLNLSNNNFTNKSKEIIKKLGGNLILNNNVDNGSNNITGGAALRVLVAVPKPNPEPEPEPVPEPVHEPNSD